MKNKLLSDLTLKEKIGQLVICGIPETYIEDNAKDIINNYKCGNILLFTRNYDNPNQLKSLNTELMEMIHSSTGIIPFIAIDQEGGSVTRLMHDVTFPPSQMTCGASSAKNSALNVGRMIGRDMIKLGLNLDFAPCFDVNRDLKNYMINTRSYSSNPLTCASMCKDFITGLSEYGVLACGKHYPGCDSENVDSHLELPISSHTKDDLTSFGLVPFINNIDVPCLMTVHCLFKELDDKPATLSRVITHDILRDELHYQGLVTTDGIEMHAISDHYGMRNAAVMAINAGCDFVLICHDYDIQLEIMDELYKAALDGRIKIEDIDEKVERILKYKNKILPYLEKHFLNNEQYLVSISNNNISQEIVDNSITLIKGDIPSFTSSSLILTPKAIVSSEVEDVFYERSLGNALKREFPEYNIKEYNYEEQVDISKYSNIILFSYDCYKNKEQADYINNILSKTNNAYVFSLKGPMDESLFNNLNNYMCMYEYTPMSIRTIIKYIRKEITENGSLPNH